MIINMHLSYQIDNENKTIFLHKYSFFKSNYLWIFSFKHWYKGILVYFKISVNCIFGVVVRLLILKITFFMNGKVK